MLDRAYSLVRIKDIDDEQRIVRGIATTPTTDRHGDIVEPLGAKYAPDLPLFLYHDSRETVGRTRLGKATRNGIPFEATLPKVTEVGRLRDRVDEAWQMLKYRLITGVSIGFRADWDDVEELADSDGVRFKSIEILELSLVPIPANADATIQAIKSLDTEPLAASGRAQFGAARRDASSSPGASGKANARKGVSLAPPKGKDMKTIAEQIAAHEAARQSKAAALNDIQTKAMEEGRGKDEQEREQFDTLKREIGEHDAELKDLRELEAMNVASARPVGNGADPVIVPRTNAASDTGEGARAAQQRVPFLRIASNLPKGTAFVRYVQALARSYGNRFEALQSAQANQAWKDTPEVALVLKAAVDAGTTTDVDWASKLVYYTNMASEFIELLRPAQILSRFGTNGIPSLRRVPMNVRMATQTAGGTYQWVGEGAAKPVGELAFGEFTMRFAKAAGIIVITEELARTSSPAAEGVVRDDMVAGMAAFLDNQFVNPEVPEVANVSPASIFSGVTPVTATGTTADALRDDIRTLLATFYAANVNPTTGVWLMSNQSALGIGMLRNALGQREFPDMNPQGGTLEGFPVIASENIQGDSNGGIIGIVNAADVFYSDDGPVTIDVSREATIQMNTTPDNPTAAGTVMVSLWQRNFIGLRAERYINWKKRRSGAAQYIQNANYGA